METTRLLIIVGMLINAPGALAFEPKPVALEIALLVGAFMTIMVEWWQEC